MRRAKGLVALFCTTVCPALLIAGGVGCASIGPRTVQADRFAYTEAIAESWKRQMLLNMVKLRYADAPVFLDVASVITQYALETEVNAGASWSGTWSNDVKSVGVRSRYTDRPTITYQPLMGQKFTRSMMTPIPPASILSLVEAGWQADMVFRIGIESINRVRNRAGGTRKARPADPGFYRLTTSLRRIQESMAVGMRIQEEENKRRRPVIFFRVDDITPQTEAEIKAVRTLLGLDVQCQQFSVIYGAVPANKREIAILSRSMLEILHEFASYIDVPAAHVADKRVRASVLNDADGAAGVRPLIRIHSGQKKPSHAFVVVRYEDHWFWIDKRDYRSKRVFSFLMFLFALAETDVPDRSPVITVPAG
jgi:hypothetical protein